jgi:hypothetical protein
MDRNLATQQNLHIAPSLVDVKSPAGFGAHAPRRGYFFFLAATLRLAGAFFFAAVFAFVAFFTMLLS